MRRIGRAAAFGILTFFLGASARATTVVALDAEALAEKSSVVGVAQVLRTQVVKAESGWVTLAELQFYKALKGVEVGEVRLVQTPGGSLGNGMSIVVDGAPKLQPGQMIFGFFHDYQGILRPTAMSLGVMPVVNDTQGVLRVVQRTGGLKFSRADGTLVGAPIQVDNRRLEDVFDEFKSIVKSQRRAVEPVDQTGTTR